MNPTLNLEISLDASSIGINLPKLKFPSIFRSSNDTVCGYFVNYDSAVTINNLDLTQHSNYSKLINSNSEFFLIINDIHKDELVLVIDQFNSIPIYFNIGSKVISISSSFGNLLKTIRNSNQNFSIDADSLLSWLLWDWHPTEKTLISNIKQIPPGTAVFINKKTGSFYFKSFIDLDKFIYDSDNLIEIPTDADNFSRLWVETLDTVIHSRVNQMKNLDIGSDVSSGLDCTLVSYLLSKNTSHAKYFSKYSSEAPDETDINKVLSFSRMHNLNVNTLDTTKEHQYVNDPRTTYLDSDPFQVSSTDFEKYLQLLELSGVSTHFNGEGGDESYGYKNFDISSKFGNQFSYFMNVMYLKKYGVSKLFEPEVTTYGVSKSRFNSRQPFPLIGPSSSMIPSSNTTWRLQMHGIHSTSPFFDTRLLKLARHNKWDKQELLPHQKCIFSQEMFTEKHGHESTFKNFLTSHKEFCLDVISQSLLHKNGWINKDEIIKLIKAENSILQSSELAIVFQNLIQLEWFLQIHRIDSVSS